MTVSSARPVAGELAHLPYGALLALAMTGFTAILNETLPAALLPQIAASLNVSEALAGQLVSSYAIGTLLAAVPLVAMTQGYRRKPTLLAGIIGLFLCNTLFAIVGTYTLALVARFMAGVASALAWGVLAGYARRMVVDGLKGKALATAMVGTPIALSIGVPVGAMVGGLLGWRTVFLGMSASTAALILWVLWKMPDFSGQLQHQRTTAIEVLRSPGIFPILAVTFAWMTAHNILYTYVAPFAGLSGMGGHVGLVLFAFGIAALLGIWGTGVLIDRMLRRLVLVSLSAFGAAALLLGIGASLPVVTFVGVIIWGMSFGGAATQILTACADASGDGMDLANAMVATVWNSAIAAGGILGGILLEHSGARSLAWAVLAAVAVAMTIAAAARRHAFKPGARVQV
jgi:predicted MFS family arabinose efflux permease